MPNSVDLSPTARAQRYERDHGHRLRALAYRMLGSRADAEDIVQEAWLRWVEVDESTVGHAGAFLSRLVTNLCLDKLRSASARREQYVGVWLPEPLLENDEFFDWKPDPAKQIEYAEDVSVAFLLALERLSPLERAAFLLHDVFDLDYDEVAHHLERSEAACRQLSSRARKNIKADYARREVAQEERDLLVSAFIDAVRGQDVAALAQVLTTDAVLLADGGGKVSALPRPLHGNDVIARRFIGFAKMSANRGWRLVAAVVNGLPGCLVFDDLAGGRLVETITLAPAPDEPGHVAAMYVQRNPDKLLAIAKRPLS
ncbi:MAG: RNA polymerase sigma factor SigJ [Woeseiaceae bacterium]